jgi:hypothetical protein
MSNHSSPMRGLRSALCIATVFVLSWKVFICLVGGAALVVLGSRFWHWAEENMQELAEAVAAGLPFALILLAAFQLK